MGIKKNGPGCCGCSSCSTSIAVHLLDLFGGTDRFCPAPGDMAWTITGTSTAGQAISLAGTVSTGRDFTLTFGATALPEGPAYTLHVFEEGTFCQQPYGPTGRFDGSTRFAVRCPATTVTLTIRAAFDVAAVMSNFAIRSCAPANDPAPTSLAVAASVSGPATLCASSRGPDGNITAYLKVTGYPWSVDFACSGANLLPSDEARTCSACGSYASDWATQPYAWYDQYAILAVGCPGCDPAAPAGGGGPLPLPGATVTLSGGVTGTGTTDGTGTGVATLTACVLDKLGTDPDALLIAWTVTADRFVGASYTESAYDLALSQQQYYGGTLCPAGGSPGAPAAGFACGGCAVPAEVTLQASTLGESYALTWSEELGWTGTFTHPIPSRACTPLGARPVNSTGPVSFFVGFTCLTLGGAQPHPYRPNRTIWYRGDAEGQPSQCSPGDSNPYTLPGAWYPIGVDFSYAERFSASCIPFMGEEDVTWTYGVQRPDGSGVVDFYSLDLDFTVSE